ncbi:hypothetical protein U0070_024454 [Myodes glareolus]|uniref:Uncharacterized protein n=1 Tax=Myodes glareolus TaxID=447135 RepID=A0AAW0H2X8_MYOGA
MALLISFLGGILDMAWFLLLLLPAACLQADVTSGSTILTLVSCSFSLALTQDLSIVVVTVFAVSSELSVIPWEDLLTPHLSPAVSTTMQSPSIITSAVTTAGLENTESKRNPSLVNLGAIIGVVVATAVLITPVYVMLIFLWWKKR